MDLDRLERLLIVLSLLSLGLVVLGLLDERLGWWNDVGEVLISFGTVASVATAVVALLVNATKGQVHRVADGVEDNGEKLDHVVQGTQTNGEKLDRVIEGTEANGDKLDVLHEDLASVDEHVEAQHDVLLQIRDRL